MYLVNFYGVFLAKKFDQINVFNLVFVGVFYQFHGKFAGHQNLLFVAFTLFLNACCRI